MLIYKVRYWEPDMRFWGGTGDYFELHAGTKKEAMEQVSQVEENFTELLQGAKENGINEAEIARVVDLLEIEVTKIKTSSRLTPKELVLAILDGRSYATIYSTIYEWQPSEEWKKKVGIGGEDE